MLFIFSVIGIHVKLFYDSANSDADCLEKQCMQTCQQCLNSTGYPCDFDDDVTGTWEIRRPYSPPTTLQVSLACSI